MKYHIGQKFGGRKVWLIWRILPNRQTLFPKHLTIKLRTIVSILTFLPNFIRQIDIFTFSPNFSPAKLLSYTVDNFKKPAALHLVKEC